MEKTKWKWGLPFLFAAVVFGVASLFYSYTVAGAQSVYMTPFLHDAKGWDIFLIEEGRSIPIAPNELVERPEETVYLSRVLEQGLEEAGLTYLKLDGTQPTSVFLDGALLYTNCPQAGGRIGEVSFPENFKGHTSQGENTLVTLPRGYGGKTLTIATRSTEQSGTPMVILTSKGTEEAELAAAVGRAAIPAVFFAMAGLLILALFLYGGSNGHWDTALVFLLLSALFQCLYYLANYDLFSVARHTIDTPFSAFFLPLSLYLPLLFLLWNMGKRRRFLAALCLGPMALSLIPPACTVLGIDLGAWYLRLPYAFYLALLAILVGAVRQAWQGQQLFRHFLLGLSLTFTGVGVLYLGSLLGGRQIAGYIQGVFRTTLLGNSAIFLGWLSPVLLTLCMAVSFMQLVENISHTQTELKALTMKNDLTLQSLALMKQSSQEVACARHDMLHHLTAMQGLAKAGAQKELNDYLVRLGGDVADIPPVRITPHPTVNSILLAIKSRARDAGVDLSTQVDLPQALPIPDSDLCIFLMNLLDNALQAAAGLPEGKGRWVALTMHIRGRYLFIEASNPYTGQVDFDPATGLCNTQKGAGHGYGMRTMQAVAKRYHSELQVEAGEDIFMVRTALLLPEA